MTPYYDNGFCQLYKADARDIPLPDQSVHVVVTSPPYYGLRVYQDNDSRGIGLEASVEAYVTNLVEVFREVRRVLRDDGVLWANLGDSYSSSGGEYSSGSYDNGTGRSDEQGPRFKRKANDAAGMKQATNPASIETSSRSVPGLGGGNRLGIPERVVLALQADGWVWRDTVIWAKKSSMPESVNGWRFERHRVTDNAFVDCPGCPRCGPNDGLVLRKGSWRTTSSHDYIFMLTKGMGYYCDADAVKESREGETHSRGTKRSPPIDAAGIGHEGWVGYMNYDDSIVSRNRRSVWNDISPEPYIKPKGSQGHHATFPSDLPRICIQAGTSEMGVCPRCGSQWARVVEHKNMVVAKSGNTNGMRTGLYGTQIEEPLTLTLGWRATCTCKKYGVPLPPAPATVLDPFCGTATTCLAAQRLGRRSVGVDLSEEYLQQAVKRLEGETLPMRISLGPTAGNAPGVEA